MGWRGVECPDLRSEHCVCVAGGRDKSDCCDYNCKQKNFGASGYYVEARTECQDFSHKLRLVTDGGFGMSEACTEPVGAYAHTCEEYAAKPDFADLNAICPFNPN